MSAAESDFEKEEIDMAQGNSTMMFPNDKIKMRLRNTINNEGLSAEKEAPRDPDYCADLICLSHLRWDFVYQRPQHILSRAANAGRVYFVEEPIFDNGSMRLDITERDSGVKVVVPMLPHGLQSEIATEAVKQQMIDSLLRSEDIRKYVLWYYTPMALEFTRHLKPSVTVYDCMDELSAFKNAPSRLRELEQELFARADLVFTGGQSLYEAKRSQHHTVYAFPSSIDRDHFAKARSFESKPEPEDQASVPHPRLGFYGVIDERFDINLLEAVADARRDWHFMIVGPVVKIEEDLLPRRSNIHYLGAKAYAELPLYLAGWDIALLLFARNDATRFISPTKTPEYLAAGKPVISTSIRDVVRPFGTNKLVEIADTPADFVTAVERLLTADRAEWLMRVDEFLAEMSWDSTWAQMWKLISEVGIARQRKQDVKSVVANKSSGQKTTVAGAA